MLSFGSLDTAIALCCSFVLSIYGLANSLCLPSEYRGTLIVEVKCKNSEGRVQAYLYSAPTYWLKTDPNTQRITRANINQNIATIVFKDIPYGQYALSLLHDMNMNNDMDYNLVGMPTEGWGFSNKRPPVLYKPSWQECSFSISSPTKMFNVSMTYL